MYLKRDIFWRFDLTCGKELLLCLCNKHLCLLYCQLWKRRFYTSFSSKFPSIKFASYFPIYMYTSGWREALHELSVMLKNTTQCARPGLKPRWLDPEMSALTKRPPPWGVVCVFCRRPRNVCVAYQLCCLRRLCSQSIHP